MTDSFGFNGNGEDEEKMVKMKKGMLIAQNR